MGARIVRAEARAWRGRAHARYSEFRTHRTVAAGFSALLILFSAGLEPVLAGTALAARLAGADARRFTNRLNDSVAGLLCGWFATYAVSRVVEDGPLAIATFSLTQGCVAAILRSH